MSYAQHQSESTARIDVVRCAVITLSDTRTAADDTSGALIRDLVTARGHAIVQHDLIKDDPDALAALLDGLLDRADVHAILTTGGTGIARRDNTIGVVERRLAPPIPGFGELFRMLSYEQIGSGAMLSRACAGVLRAPGARRVLIFCMPGNASAVELAMTKLVLPELKHLAWELNR